MAMSHTYETAELTRADVDARTTPLVLEFGTPWCGYCQAAQPLIAKALEDRPDLQHVKIEDGKGKPLGRSFQVKLWPTLVVLDRGRELARVVRPDDVEEISAALSRARAA
jgi:thioredoxin 1